MDGINPHENHGRLLHGEKTCLTASHDKWEYAHNGVEFDTISATNTFDGHESKDAKAEGDTFTRAGEHEALSMPTPIGVNDPETYVFPCRITHFKKSLAKVKDRIKAHGEKNLDPEPEHDGPAEGEDALAPMESFTVPRNVIEILVVDITLGHFTHSLGGKVDNHMPTPIELGKPHTELVS